MDDDDSITCSHIQHNRIFNSHKLTLLTFQISLQKYQQLN